MPTSREAGLIGDSTHSRPTTTWVGDRPSPAMGSDPQIGDRFWLLRSEASTDLFHPFLRLRAFGAAGEVRDRGQLPDLSAQPIARPPSSPPASASGWAGTSFAWTWPEASGREGSGR